MIIEQGDCVKIPDGRVGRVREVIKDTYKVRVQRQTSKTPQLIIFLANQLSVVACPTGWMSKGGYNRYLRVTLEKMAIRNRKKSASQ